MKTLEISSKTMSNLDLIAKKLSKNQSEVSLNQMFLADKKRVSICSQGPLNAKERISICEAGCEHNSCNSYNGS